MSNPERAGLSDLRVHPKLKLAAAWAAVMFCYVYGDIFDLYRAAKINQILAGRTPLGPTSQGMLLGFSAMMAVPSLMVLASMILPPALNRILNIVFGLAFTGIVLATLPGSWMFTVFLGAIEMALTLAIVWIAWTWPRERVA